jgi:hypothetical protein
MELKQADFKTLKAFNKARDRQVKLNEKRIAERDESKRLDLATPNEDDIKKIKKALRQVWSWSHSRRLVTKRCDLGEGYSRCEKCKKKCPKIFIDHIEPVGTFDKNYIDRLFVPSKRMQGLCVNCHKSKTKTDLANIKRSKTDVGDFF